MWPVELKAVRVIDLLRVPFKVHGDDMSGWDCVGCARFLTRTAFGVEVKSFDDQYTGADWADVATLEAAIAREVGSFMPCDPQFGAWLVLKRFGHACHIGWCIDAKTFIHAEDAGPVKGALRTVKGGGTYTAPLAEWVAKKRFVGAFMPAGVRR
jgi:hypothetical protein